MDKTVDDRSGRVEHADDAVTEDEHYGVMKGTRWVYPKKDRDLHSYSSGAVGDDDAQRTGDLARASVGQRLKAFLRKLVGRQNG